MFADSGLLLCISVTINLCTLSYFGCGRAVEYVGTKYGDRNRFFAILIDLHRRKPWLFGKTITENAVTCILIVLSVTALSSTSVSVHPFSGNQTAPLDSLVQTALSANIGRYIYMCMQDGFLYQHLNHFKTDLIHHLVTVGAYVVFLAYQQNVFLSVAGLLMELNVIPIEIGRLVREVSKHCLLYKRITIASCAVTMVSRGVMPIVVLAIALKQESPFSMRIAPLTVFFLCIVFFFVINFWMILQTVSRVVRYSPCGPGEVDEDNLNYVTVRNPMEPQSRDIVLPGQGDRQSVTFSNLNYGYLKSYDNRNVCNNLNDKINFSTKKVSKPNLAYKGPKIPMLQIASEHDDVSRNHVDVVHNNFRRSRVRFQDEVDTSPVTTPQGSCCIDASTDGGTRVNSSILRGNGGNCSSSVLVHPLTNIQVQHPLASLSIDPPMTPNNVITNLSETVEISSRMSGGTS